MHRRNSKKHHMILTHNTQHLPSCVSSGLPPSFPQAHKSTHTRGTRAHTHGAGTHGAGARATRTDMPSPDSDLSPSSDLLPPCPPTSSCVHEFGWDVVASGCSAAGLSASSLTSTCHPSQSACSGGGWAVVRPILILHMGRFTQLFSGARHSGSTTSFPDQAQVV